MSASAGTTSSSAYDPDFELEPAWVQADQSSTSSQPPSSRLSPAELSSAEQSLLSGQEPSYQQPARPPSSTSNRGHGARNPASSRRGAPMRTAIVYPVRQPTVPPNGSENSSAVATTASRHQQRQQPRTPARTSIGFGQRGGGRGSASNATFSDIGSTVATVHTASTGSTFRGDPGSFMVPQGSYIRSSAYADNEQVGGVGPDEYGTEGFVRPHILLPEDEDYDEDHPAGFRRANEADLAERSGNPPDTSFVLPARRHAEFDTRFFGVQSHNVLHIARKTGTHISMPVDLNEPVLFMWGTPDRLLAARQDLHALLEQVQHDIEQGQRRASGWAKIKAMPSDKKQQMIDDMIQAARIRKMYRQPPPPDTHFPAVGLFLWPSKERDPQQVLGMACEALDDIRFDQKVWILFVRKANVFRVLGNDSKNVEIAVERIRGVFCEVAAKRRRPTKMVLLQPPSEELAATKIVANENHDLINRQVTVKRLEANKGIQVFLGGTAPNPKFREMWKTKREILARANDTYVRKVLEQGLQDLPYFIGHVRMRVYIGKMVLFGYRRARDGVYSILDFGEMVRNSQTVGELIRCIGSGRYGVEDSDVANELIETCGRLFSPKDTCVDFESDARTVEPQISATFELKLYDEQGTAQDIRLEVCFQRLPGRREYRALDRRWLNARDREGHKSTENPRKGPLDIKVMDVEADLGYQIEIVTWSAYRETHYPIFQEFSRALGIEYIPNEFTSAPLPEPGQPDTRPTIPRVTFINLPGMSVSGVVQKTKYRYYMPRSSYVFELTRYEHLPVHVVSTLYPDGVPVSYKNLDTPFDTRWGCSLSHNRWDEYLSQQAVVGLGQRGNWEPDIEKFFPSSPVPPAHSSNGGTVGEERVHVPNDYNDDGFAEFLGTIREAVRVVKAAQESVARKKMTCSDSWVGTVSAATSDWTGTPS